MGFDNSVIAGLLSELCQRSDKPLSRGVVAGSAFLAFDDGQQAGRQFLAELHAPLVEGVDAEEHAFDEDAVLVERDQPAERAAASSLS